MTVLADGGNFVFILPRSCKKITDDPPKTKDQKKNVGLMRRRRVRAAFQATLDELTLFSFPLNRRFRSWHAYIRGISQRDEGVLARPLLRSSFCDGE